VRFLVLKGMVFESIDFRAVGV